jgi:hypothetical protein
VVGHLDERVKDLLLLFRIDQTVFVGEAAAVAVLLVFLLGLLLLWRFFFLL